MRGGFFRFAFACAMTFGMPSIRLRIFGMRCRRRREIARDQQIDGIGETLVVSERVPLRVFHFLEAEDFAFDVLFQDAEIDTVRAGQLRAVLEAVQLGEELLLRGEFLRARFLRVVSQLVVETVVAELRRVFGIRAEPRFDVIVRELLEFVVGGCGATDG